MLLWLNIKNIDLVLLICNNYWYFVIDGNGKYIFIRGYDGWNFLIVVVEFNVDVIFGKICNIIKNDKFKSWFIYMYICI